MYVGTLNCLRASEKRVKITVFIQRPTELRPRPGNVLNYTPTVPACVNHVESSIPNLSLTRPLMDPYEARIVVSVPDRLTSLDYYPVVPVHNPHRCSGETASGAVRFAERRLRRSEGREERLMPFSCLERDSDTKNPSLCLGSLCSGRGTFRGPETLQPLIG
jgi:hypothetical protein